jgi:hypothetical protein
MSKYVRLGFAILLGALALGPGSVGRADDDDDDPIPFDTAMVFFELNNGDGSPLDLGFHIKADGEAWRFLRITGPGHRRVVELETRGAMRRTGGSEFFLEGAEPPVTEVPIAETLLKFPEGNYRFVGRTVDGVDMLGKAALTHAVPDGPVVDVDLGPPLVIRWEQVTARHPDFPPGDITIVAYQVIVDSFQVTVPDTGAPDYVVTVPPEFVESLEPGEHGFEVLAIEEGGNQTITEGSFLIP